MTHFWVSGGGGITSLKHLKAAQRGDAKVQVHQGIKPRSQLYSYQVLLLEIIAAERDLVKNVPVKKKYILKVALSCALCSLGLFMREGKYWAFSHLRCRLYYLSSPRKGECLAKSQMGITS